MAHFSLISNIHSTTTSTVVLYHFMGDFNNFKHLLPTEKIENFDCSADQCSFGIKGLMPLTIKIKESVFPNRITYETSGLAKFVFTLHIHFKNSEQVYIELEGDMNPFIKVMAEKPLNDLINTMALKLSEVKL